MHRARDVALALNLGLFLMWGWRPIPEVVWSVGNPVGLDTLPAAP